MARVYSEVDCVHRNVHHDLQTKIYVNTNTATCFQGVHLCVFFSFVRVLVLSLLLVCKEISTWVFGIWITLGLVLFACNLFIYLFMYLYMSVCLSVCIYLFCALVKVATNVL